MNTIHPILDLSKNIARPFEGLSLTPYYDPVGFATIGYGHLLTKKPYADLNQWQPITHDMAEALLTQDMTHAYRHVLRLIRVSLSYEQMAALTDFVFNCGAGHLQASTLLRRLNQGFMNEIPHELQKWVYAAGIKLPGLVRRRHAEAQLWQQSLSNTITTGINQYDPTSTSNPL